MDPSTRIRKSRNAGQLEPNLRDYDEARRSFSWEEARQELSGSGDWPAINIAHETIDRHVAGSRGDRVAIRFLPDHGNARDYSYRELKFLTNRFANLIRALGVGQGDVVAALLGRVPELYITALGTLKNRAIFCPLFSAFGPDPIRTRLALSRAKLLVTTDRIYRRKVAGIRDHLPDLRSVIVLHRDDVADKDTIAWNRAMAEASDAFTIEPTEPEAPALLHFTSGTTGAPKGALHVHSAVVSHYVTGKIALDLHPDDLFWCTADPGWVTGISYGMIAPLSIGATILVDECEFDVERWYRNLQDEKVSVWYTAPTAVRMLMKCGAEAARRYDFSRLRFMASVGEPLNAQAVIWGSDVLGLPFHDNWWQTETGSIMVANLRSMDVKPGSMGRVMPGIDAAVVRSKTEGLEILGKGEGPGELALRVGWPSMFRGYLGDDKRYARCFRNSWYLTGDLVREDDEGYFWFIGREDDVINSSGHLIGPVEIEGILREHPAVMEAAAIGIPDPIAMETVKAFVQLTAGHEPTDALKRELLGFARTRLGGAIAPREIEFRGRVPKTRSGKIMRRLLKAQELGLPTGDVSAVENEG